MSFSYQHKLSHEAQRICDLIGNGGALRVPYSDEETATVVPRLNLPASLRSMQDWQNPTRLTVTSAVRDELLESGLIAPLTRKRHFQKVGWEECGFDGSKAEFWCLIQ